MNENDEFKPSIAGLRLKVATNLFKMRLLGDLHVPQKAQTSTVFEALTGSLGEDSLTERTWQAWFSNTHRVPKIDKIKYLDTLASSVTQDRAKDGFAEEALPVSTFSDLIHGGLLHHMLAPSKSKQPLHMLMARASDYQPVSPLHLHLDAIEIEALVDGYGDIPWVAVKAIGASRIMELLDERWGPRHGSIYKGPSNLRLKWEAASPEDRVKITQSYASINPDFLEYMLNAKVNINWNLTGVDMDVSPLHIYKVLFALAADTEFLIAKRLEDWSLDLATSALAMHSLAWSDRYTTFGATVTNEMIFWAAFHELLFNPESFELDNVYLNDAMARCNADWSIGAVEKFLRARNIYHSRLTELGLSVNEIADAAMYATTVYRLEYSA
jgi:hypothetical protein